MNAALPEEVMSRYKIKMRKSGVSEKINNVESAARSSTADRSAMGGAYWKSCGDTRILIDAIRYSLL